MLFLSIDQPKLNESFKLKQNSVDESVTLFACAHTNVDVRLELKGIFLLIIF